MVKLLNVYYKSPIMLQHLLTSLYGYKLKRDRYNYLYRDYLNQYINYRISPEQELLKLLNHLSMNIETYKEINIDSNNLYDTFMSLPFTSKDDLRNELSDRSFLQGILRQNRTSGTTGKNLIVHNSEYDRAKRMAYLDYIKLLHGVKPFSKRASFTGNEISQQNNNNVIWRYNFPINQVLYATYQFNHLNMKNVFDNLKKQQPVSLDGYPSAIHMIAKYIIQNNEEVLWDVKAVFPTAEVLAPHVKRDIEAALNTTVVDQYASSEGAPFIYTDIEGKYTIGHETGIFEFFKVEGSIYEIVVTSFLNYATPIIRYKIGDQAEIKSEKSYLNSYTDDFQIERIIGRKSDYLMGSNHNKITDVNISWIIDGFEEKVIQFQLIQKNINKFVMNMVVEDDFDKEKDVKELTERLNRKMGHGNEYDFIFMTDIPRQKNGKIRFIINEMGDTHE